MGVGDIFNLPVHNAKINIALRNRVWNLGGDLDFKGKATDRSAQKPAIRIRNLQPTTSHGQFFFLTLVSYSKNHLLAPSL